MVVAPSLGRHVPLSSERRWLVVASCCSTPPRRFAGLAAALATPLHRRGRGHGARAAACLLATRRSSRWWRQWRCGWPTWRSSRRRRGSAIPRRHCCSPSGSVFLGADHLWELSTLASDTRAVASNVSIDTTHRLERQRSLFHFLESGPRPFCRRKKNTSESVLIMRTKCTMASMISSFLSFLSPSSLLFFPVHPTQ